MSAVVPASRVALITGGASGIGLAVAERLQRRAWKLAPMDLGEPALQAAARHPGDGELPATAGHAIRRRPAMPSWDRGPRAQSCFTSTTNWPGPVVLKV
jgi:NAD(P)-dependent dehydrogenase (short-subunit alcohol dehydrogenase family)